eukprot:11201154-Lingulodinium_polyedra.AAC.1
MNPEPSTAKSRTGSSQMRASSEKRSRARKRNTTKPTNNPSVGLTAGSPSATKRSRNSPAAA